MPISRSIKERISAQADERSAEELRMLLEAILTDLTAVRASVNGIATKLDADAGVTDTNYSSLWAVAALTLTS